MLKPIVQYGCETWAMTEQIKSPLKTWERKMLGKIDGLMNDQNCRRIQTNDEVQATYRKPSIVTTITVRILERAARLVRMSDDRTVKKVFLGKPDGRRIAGRQQLRWLSCIENDFNFNSMYLPEIYVHRYRISQHEYKIVLQYKSSCISIFTIIYVHSVIKYLKSIGAKRCRK
jgi:hypothetical protein